MEDKTKINKLANKLDQDLQSLLFENANYLPTITSTFECIENSSDSFKELLKHNFSLEYGIKKEIGKALNYHYSLETSIKPPYTPYFRYILTALIAGNLTSD